MSDSHDTETKDSFFAVKRQLRKSDEQIILHAYVVVLGMMPCNFIIHHTIGNELSLFKKSLVTI